MTTWSPGRAPHGGCDSFQHPAGCAPAHHAPGIGSRSLGRSVPQIALAVVRTTAWPGSRSGLTVHGGTDDTVGVGRQAREAAEHLLERACRPLVELLHVDACVARVDLPE